MMHEAIIDETLAVFIERSAPSRRDVFSPDCVFFFPLFFFPFFFKTPSVRHITENYICLGKL